MVKTMDRWLALVASAVCLTMTIMIATAPIVHRVNEVQIPDNLAIWARHWFEAGLIVFAIFFIFIHITVNRKPK